MTMQSYADSGMAASLCEGLRGARCGPCGAVADPPNGGGRPPDRVRCYAAACAPSAALKLSGSGIERPAA